MSINISPNTSLASNTAFRLQSDSAASISGGRVLGGGDLSGVRLIGGSIVSLNPRRNGYRRINDSENA